MKVFRNCISVGMAICMGASSVYAQNMPQSSALPAIASPLQGTTISELATKLPNTMNFNGCLNYKVTPAICKNACLGRIPAPGIKFSYQQPSALVEVTCRRGTTEFGAFNIVGAVTGGADKPEQQDCIRSAKQLNQAYGARHFFDVHVYGVQPTTYYFTSATPTQASLANTCGVLGKIGMFINIATLMATFNPTTFLSSLNPATMLQNVTTSIQSGITNLTNTITSLPTQLANQIASIPTSISNLATSIANIPSQTFTNLQTTFNNISTSMNNLGNLSTVNLTNLANGATAFSSIGQSISNIITGLGPVAALIPGVPQLQAVAQSATSMGSILSMGATGLANPQSVIDGIQTGFLNFTNGIQEALAAASGQIASSMATIADVPASIASSQVSGYSDTTLQWAMTNPMTGGLTIHTQFQALQAKMLAESGDNEGVATSKSTKPQATIAMPKLTSISAEDIVGLPPKMNSGSSQLGLTAAMDLQDRMLNDISKGAPIAAQETAAQRQSANTDATTHCINFQDLYRIKSELSKIKETLNNQQHGPSHEVVGTFFQPATYLAAGLPQGAEGSIPNASCPLTHAGVVSVQVASNATNGGHEKRMVNCVEYCYGNEENRVCKWAPAPGYGGNCVANPISEVHINGQYLACHGQLAHLVANNSGDMIPSIGGYRPAFDHLAQLNQQRSEQFKATVNQALAVIEPALQAQHQAVLATGQTCELPKPNGDTQTLASVRLHPTLLSEPGLSATGEIMAPTKAQLTSPGSGFNLPGSDGLSGITSALTGYLDSFNAILSKGGIQQMFAGNAARFIPFGLTPAFMSEQTTWAQPKIGDSIAAAGINAFMAAGGHLVMCALPSAANSLGFGNLVSLNTTFCEGVAGPLYPTTGWASNQYKPVAASLIAARGYKQAVALKTVTPNTKGTQQFNYDNPIHAASPFSQSAGFSFAPANGRHRGSGCYDRGTASQSWFTAGESIGGAVAAGITNAVNPLKFVPGAETVDAKVTKGDYHLFTFWKRTSCCITPCGIKHEY